MSPRRRQARGSVTIVDVAREAGVSVSTVSRVVRNHADVNEETRQHVRQVIRSLGYRPSAVARALVTGHAKTIGLLVSDIVNPFYPQLARSIEREAREHGYVVVICNTEDREDETANYVERLLDEGVEGVIHASVGRDEGRTLEQLRGAAEIVFTNRRPSDPACNYIVADNYVGAADLTRHLVALGHRRIGFVKGPDYASNAQERLRGFLDTAEAAGIEALVAEGDFLPESAAAAVARWLEDDPPTALIGVNDVVALGAYDALLAAGRSVPEDMAVAGFDDIALAGSRMIGLTSVSQHIHDTAVGAVRMLIRLAGDEDGCGPDQQVLRPQLIVRRSTVGARVAPAPSG